MFLLLYYFFLIIGYQLCARCMLGQIYLPLMSLRNKRHRYSLSMKSSVTDTHRGGQKLKRTRKIIWKDRNFAFVVFKTNFSVQLTGKKNQCKPVFVGLLSIFSQALKDPLGPGPAQLTSCNIYLGIQQKGITLATQLGLLL